MRFISSSSSSTGLFNMAINFPAGLRDYPVTHPTMPARDDPLTDPDYFPGGQFFFDELPHKIR
jgi:hypothetical protein